MAERDKPELDRVRDALREHDERPATEGDDDDSGPDDEPQEQGAAEDEAYETPEEVPRPG